MVVLAIPLLIGGLIGAIAPQSYAEMNRAFLSLFGFGGLAGRPSVVRGISVGMLAAATVMIVLHFGFRL
jgi:hypothetical protein